MNTLYYICAKVFCNVIFHDFLMIRQESLKNKTFLCAVKWIIDFFDHQRDAEYHRNTTLNESDYISVMVLVSAFDVLEGLHVTWPF